MIGKVILVTSASNELGRLAANALSHSGHTVYAALANPRRGARLRTAIAQYAGDNGLDMRAIGMDARRQPSIETAIRRIVDETGRIDVVVHTAEALAFGPAEAFEPEQFADIYDRIVLAAQRVNRSVLPHMRRRGEGLLVWISSSGSAGGMLPYLAPHLVARAGLDALAVQYARELARWGIETTIIVPGAQVYGSPPLAGAAAPGDQARAAEYESGPLAGMGPRIRRAMAGLLAAEIDVGPVAGAIVEAVDTPFGERPFRIHVDPAEDGGAVAFAVVDRLRNEMLTRAGLNDLIRPRRHADCPAGEDV